MRAQTKGAVLQRKQERFPTIIPRFVTTEPEGPGAPRIELAKYISFTKWLSLGAGQMIHKNCKALCPWKRFKECPDLRTLTSFASSQLRTSGIPQACASNSSWTSMAWSQKSKQLSQHGFCSWHKVSGRWWVVSNKGKSPYWCCQTTEERRPMFEFQKNSQ